MGEKTFDIEGLLYSIKKKWWVILLIVVLTGGIGIFKASKMQESYTASVKIFSGKTEEITDRYSRGELTEYSALMSTYIEVIKTTSFMEDVSIKSGTKIPAIQLVNGVQFGVTEGTPILEISYTAMEYDVAKKVVETIAAEFSTGVEEIILGVHTKVIEDIRVVPNYPNKKKVVAISILFGMLIAIGIIFILDYLDNTVKDKEDIENIIKIPVIGELPYEKGRKNNKGFIVKDDIKNIASEYYRKLRTGFEYASLDTDIKTLVITSSEIGEGKSTVAGNFAYVTSQNEKKVLIIDCDLRRPTMHKRFKVSNDEGLTNYLVGKSDLKNIVKKVDKNLDLIPAGEIPPNPSEILSSNKLYKFIKALKNVYDLIILDTPPVRAVTDGQILAGKMDGTLFIVRSEKTKVDSVINGYKELEKVNANILGVVINGEAIEKKNSYYYGYSEK